MNFFNDHAAIIVDSATNPAARAFAEKVVAQVTARGEAWIEAHKDALKVRGPAYGPESEAPTADNRGFFLTHWQLALASA